MKKTLGVVAAAALAAAPALSVFATDLTTQTDTLKITIGPVCSFGHKFPASGDGAGSVVNVAVPSHADGTGTYAGEWGSGATADTLAATFVTGVTDPAIGTTTLNVYCNDAQGYKITASGAGALAGTTASGNKTIPLVADFSDTKSGWSYKVAADTASTQRGAVINNHTDWVAEAAANNEIAKLENQTTANAGDTYTITYGVGINQTQAADVYTGSITYTLAAL